MAFNTHILMLSGDPDDRLITESTVKELGYDISVKFISYSSELLISIYADRPGLIIIDYNSKPENATVVLKQLKNNSGTNDIPVVVLSENNSPDYISACYRLGASSYIKKPAGFLESKEKISLFLEYWIKVVQV